MTFFKKTILLYVSLLLTSCAGGKAVSPDAVVAPPRFALQSYRGTPLEDPDRGLKSALEAYHAEDWSATLAIAGQLREEFPDTPWYKRSLFLTEQALIQLDRDSEADAAALRVKAEYPLLADYAFFTLAEYHYSKMRFTRASALYQQVMVRYPRSSLATRAAYRYAQALLETGAAYAPAAEVFEKFLQDHPGSELSPDAGLGLGRALMAEQEQEKAFVAYRNVQIKYPGTPADLDVEKALTELRGRGIAAPEFAAEELYERGKNLFRTSQYDKAIETFTKLLKSAPSYPNRPDALFKSGIALFYLGRRTEAAATIERLLKDHPGDQRVPEALYWLGKSYSKLGERDKGIQTFRRILDSYSESEWADDALFLTGNIYREAGDMKKALEFYRRLSSEYPESKYADSAFWWQAWAYYGAGEHRKAEQTLQALVNRYPRSFLVHQARYWQGRLSEKMGETAKAAAYYGKVVRGGPYTYYGYRAAERLAGIRVSDPLMKADDADGADPAPGEGPGADDTPVPSDADEGPPVWTAEALKTLSSEPPFTKALELLYLNMKKEAAAELSLLQDHLPKKRGTLLGLSKTFFELGDYYRSLVLVLTNYERYLDGKAAETPKDFWLLAYPQGYWDSIASYSRHYGPDPYFVAAIIREESQFHAEALSPAGARGVMQVMPSTGAWVAQNIRLRGFDPNKLYDSDTAINIGTWYIAHLMKRFKGNELFAAAAYNAGPEAVSAWLSRNGPGADRDEFVEAIPFPETRGYVKKVMRNYSEYKRIYGKAVPNTPRYSSRNEGTIGPSAGLVEVKTQ